MTTTPDDEMASMAWTSEMLDRIRQYGPSSELLDAVEYGLIHHVVPDQIPSRERPAHHYGEMSVDALRTILTSRDRQLFFLKTLWVRDAKEALDGKPHALRNRIEMYEAPPVEITNGTEP